MVVIDVVVVVVVVTVDHKTMVIITLVVIITMNDSVVVVVVVVAAGVVLVVVMPHNVDVDHHDSSDSFSHPHNNTLYRESTHTHNRSLSIFLVPSMVGMNKTRTNSTTRVVIIV